MLRDDASISLKSDIRSVDFDFFDNVTVSDVYSPSVTSGISQFFGNNSMFREHKTHLKNIFSGLDKYSKYKKKLTTSYQQYGKNKKMDFDIKVDPELYE